MDEKELEKGSPAGDQKAFREQQAINGDKGARGQLSHNKSQPNDSLPLPPPGIPVESKERTLIKADNKIKCRPILRRKWIKF